MHVFVLFIFISLTDYYKTKPSLTDYYKTNTFKSTVFLISNFNNKKSYQKSNSIL